MYKGKKKCKILKQIRAEIAKNNGIDYVVEECKHQGDCKGTCPKCEAEVRMLERELEARRNVGKRVLLAGVAAGIALTGASCTPDAPDVTAGLPEPTYGYSQTVSTAQTKDPTENELMGTPMPEDERETELPAVTPGAVEQTTTGQNRETDDPDPLEGEIDDEEILMGEPAPAEEDDLMGTPEKGPEVNG